MAKMLNWNPGPAMDEAYKGGMSRIKRAAEIIRDEAKSILASQMKHNWPEHGPYRTGYSKKKKAWIYQN